MSRTQRTSTRPPDHVCVAPVWLTAHHSVWLSIIPSKLPETPVHSGSFSMLLLCIFLGIGEERYSTGAAVLSTPELVCEKFTTWNLPLTSVFWGLLKQYFIVNQRTMGWEFPGGLMAKDLALLLWWHRFNPWPRNFYMPWAQPKQKIKKEQLWAENFVFWYSNLRQVTLIQKVVAQGKNAGVGGGIRRANARKCGPF